MVILELIELPFHRLVVVLDLLFKVTFAFLKGLLKLIDVFDVVLLTI